MKVIMTQEMRMKTVREKGRETMADKYHSHKESFIATEESLNASDYHDFVFVVGLASHRWKVISQ